MFRVSHARSRRIVQEINVKLFYYKDPIGNFGDDLNPYIWYNLAPELFDDDDETVLVGIGTLINNRAPERPNKIVFGSGVGYHQFPDIGKKWHFCCVRGPRSAQRLGLDSSYVATDPANLLTEVVGKSQVKRVDSVCFMPHHASARFADWKDLCAKAGIVYIDPATDIHESLHTIRRSRLVIAEAMHAAIVADTFRTPWVPVVCYDHILDLKWRDWCESLMIDYDPVRIPSIWDMERFKDRATVFKSRLKRGLKDIGIWSNHWTPPVPRTNRESAEAGVVAALIDIASRHGGVLSSDANYRAGQERVWEKLVELRQNHGQSAAAYSIASRQGVAI